MANGLGSLGGAGLVGSGDAGVADDPPPPPQAARNPARKNIPNDCRIVHTVENLTPRHPVTDR